MIHSGIVVTMAALRHLINGIIIVSDCIDNNYAFSALTLFFGHLTCKNFCFKTPWDGS